jgi:hypothetical protein
MTTDDDHYDPKGDSKARLGAIVFAALVIWCAGKLAHCLPVEPPTLVRPTAVALVCLALCLSACGHGAQACAVVDVAAKACSVVRYLAPDGTVREVRVEPYEIAAFGEQMAARRASEKR